MRHTVAHQGPLASFSARPGRATPPVDVRLAVTPWSHKALRIRIAAPILAALLAFAPDAPGQPAKSGAIEPRQLEIANNPFTGDFDAMIERRLVRVSVPFSRTLYFNDRGRERGLSAELVRDFEGYINRKYRKKLGRRPITVVIIPSTRDGLLSEVAAGFSDIVAGNLTVTEDRLRMVDFAVPRGARTVSEVLLTGPRSPAITSIHDLAGKTVHVRRASSYFESLFALNENFRGERRARIKLVLVPDAVEDEDMMEMLNAGSLEAIVVDDWKARLWAKVLPRVKIHEDVVLRESGKIGWAIRKGSPKLEAAINDFFVNYANKQGVIPYRLQQYQKQIGFIKDPTATAEWKRFQKTLDLFRKYGEKYHFDPLMLAAQGYQESRLQQSARSPAGAIGIMQVMPATGKAMKVGDIKVLEPNIHAAAKYLDQIMTRYFSDAHFSDSERALFAFASYNAGPTRISSLRRLAAKRGLDPDHWFGGVELVVAEKVGIETTRYVRNIYKYYIAYTLMLEAEADQQKARDQLRER